MSWSRRSKIAVSAAVGAAIGAGALLGSCDAVLGVGKFTYGACDTKGDLMCVGSSLQICGDDGTWMPLKQCDDQACNADAGGCVGTCTPDASQCADELNAKTCNSAGQWQTSPCPFVCINGQCGGECHPDASSCSEMGVIEAASIGAVQLVCSDAGQWLVNACPCVHGQCTACEPGHPRCTTDTQSQGCDDAGSWLDATDCKAGEKCFPHSGICDTVCIPGDGGTPPRCNGNDVQVCSSGGDWVTTKSCLDPCRPCLDAKCQIAVDAGCSGNCVTSGTCDQNGECVANPSGSVECAAGSPGAGCNAPACDKDSGLCAAPDNQSCDPDDKCVTSSTCQSGVCVGSGQPNHHWAHWQFPKTPPSPRFFPTADVVYDQLTHLTWQRVPSATLFSEGDAATYCACLNSPPPPGPDCTPYNTHIVGYREGWRLPTRIELASLVQYDKSGLTPPLIDASFTLLLGESLLFWSARAPGKPPWGVDFGTGFVTTVSGGTYLPVRCVR